MTRPQRDSLMAITCEYTSKLLTYGAGYFMARLMSPQEFGNMAAALAYAMVIMSAADSGMGQMVAKHIAQSPSGENGILRQLITWRSLVILLACLGSCFIAPLFLPLAAAQLAFWLVPFCLLTSFIDFSAWVLKGLQRIPSYCALLLSSRALLFAFSLIALSIRPNTQSLLYAYGLASLSSTALAFFGISRYVGPLRLQKFEHSFLRNFLPELYKYSFIVLAGVLMSRADLISVAKFIGETQAGLYGCAAYIIDGLNILPMAVYSVYLSRFSKHRNEPFVLARLLRTPLLSLTVASLGIVGVGYWASAPLLQFFFGERYLQSQFYLKPLLWSCVPFYANALLWALLLAKNQLRALALSLGIGLFCMLLAMGLLVPMFGVTAAAWSRVLGCLLVFILCSYYVLKLQILPTSSGLGATPAKASKLLNFFTYSFKLGARWTDRWAILYMFLRWKVRTRLSSSFSTPCPLPPVIHIRFRGKKLAIHTSDDTSFPHLFYEVFISEDYRTHLEPAPQIIFDIGAHFGLAALYFACIYPDATIHSFEPSSMNFQYLQRNTRIFPNIHPHPIGMFSHTGSAEFYLHPSSGENSLLAQEARSERISVTTLDDFIAQNNIQRIDLLKIDVEGAEEAILSTSHQLGLIGTMIGELHFELINWSHLQKVLENHFEVACHPVAYQRATFTAIKKAPLRRLQLAH